MKNHEADQKAVAKNGSNVRVDVEHYIPKKRRSPHKTQSEKTENRKKNLLAYEDKRVS